MKEIRTLDSAVMTTGEVHWAAEPSVWFIMVKDRKERFTISEAAVRFEVGVASIIRRLKKP